MRLLRGRSMTSKFNLLSMQCITFMRNLYSSPAANNTTNHPFIWVHAMLLMTSANLLDGNLLHATKLNAMMHSGAVSKLQYLKGFYEVSS